MNSFEAFVMYSALKSHFTRPSYDYFKYNGKIKADPDKFKHRRDRYYFDKLAKMPDVQGYLLANFINSPGSWIGDFMLNGGFGKYDHWKRINQSLEYTFKQEINWLFDYPPEHKSDLIQDSFKVKEGMPPGILAEYLRGDISIETLIILIDISRLMSYYDKELKDDVNWEHIRLKLTKYKPFMKYDRKKMKEIFKKELNLA